MPVPFERLKERAIQHSPIQLTVDLTFLSPVCPFMFSIGL